jgi:hypothetical protein
MQKGEPAKPIPPLYLLLATSGQRPARSLRRRSAASPAARLLLTDCPLRDCFPEPSRAL